MNRIICIGSEWVAEDSAGPRVLAILRQRKLPPGVELVDGGLGGLSLLGLMDGATRIVFVDRVQGFSDEEPVVVLPAQEVASLATDRFGHDAGLPYLLRVLPAACEVSVPEVLLVGVEDPGAAGASERAADFALALAGGASERGERRGQVPLPLERGSP